MKGVIVNYSIECVVSNGNHLGEGPIWDVEQGVLYWVDGTGRRVGNPSIWRLDPRSGESTYRLLSIVRAEPDASLFQVPPDYTVRETGIRSSASRSSRISPAAAGAGRPRRHRASARSGRRGLRI